MTRNDRVMIQAYLSDTYSCIFPKYAIQYLRYIDGKKLRKNIESELYDAIAKLENGADIEEIKPILFRIATSLD